MLKGSLNFIGALNLELFHRKAGNGILPLRRITLMSSLHTAEKAKSLKVSIIYRESLFIFIMMLFLSALFVSQSAVASNSSFQAPYIKTVGYSFQQQYSNFNQAQIAFENHDYAYSARLLQVLAKNGHIQAQYLLATQYDAGLGVKQDEQASFHWYKEAAKGGIEIAQHNLAVAYAQGNGVKADLTKAITWWKRAAVAGNTDSQYNLGIIYAAGRGHIKPNLEEALKWWRMAAINGDPAAQFNLGALYANGIGMSSRTCEASRWWKKSAANGFARAEMALAVLETKQDYDVCR